MKLRWTKETNERWRSGDYLIWVQTRVREGVALTNEYAAQYMDEQPWLIERGSFADAKDACEKHARGEEDPCTCPGECEGCSGGMLKRDCPCEKKTRKMKS